MQRSASLGSQERGDIAADWGMLLLQGAKWWWGGGPRCSPAGLLRPLTPRTAYRSSHLAGTPQTYRCHAAISTASMLAHGGRTASRPPPSAFRLSTHLAGTPRRYRLHAAIGTVSMLVHGGVPITSKIISSSWCVARLPTGPSVAYDSSSVGVGGKSALVMANTGAT